MKRAAFLIVVSCLAITGACSDDGGEASTTSAPTTTIAPVTTVASPGTTAATSTSSPGAATTTAVPEDTPTFPEYTIVSRQVGAAGDTVVVLLDPESYTKLTDIDLANVLADLADRFPPILTAYVIDSAEVVDAVVSEEPTAAEQELLAHHYLVRLEEGFRMVFAGPFADFPIAILGS